MTKVKEQKDKGKNWIEKTLGFKGYILYIWNSKLMICTLKPLSHIPRVIRINNQERFILREPALAMFGKPVYILLRGYPVSIDITMCQTTNPIIVDTISFIEPNEVISKTISENNELDVSVIHPDKISKWIQEYESKGKKKAINSRKKLYTKGFERFLKEKMDSNEESDLDFGIQEFNTIVLEKRLIQEFESSFDFDSEVQSGYTNVVLRQKPLSTNLVIALIFIILFTASISFILTSTYYQSIIDGLRLQLIGG